LNIRRKNGSSIDVASIECDSKHIGLVFSGIGYTCRNPLLYYSRKILLELKIDYMGIDYRYYEDSCFLNASDEEKDEYFEQDNALVVEHVKDMAKTHEKVFLIGKSMGTSVIRRCMRHPEISKKAYLVLMTPGTEWPEFIPELKPTDNPALLIGSLKDPYFAVSNLHDVYDKKNLTLMELENGDHSLEVNDVEKDIETLKKVMLSERLFIRNCLRC